MDRTGSWFTGSHIRELATAWISRSRGLDSFWPLQALAYLCTHKCTEIHIWKVYDREVPCMWDPGSSRLKFWHWNAVPSSRKAAGRGSWESIKKEGTAWSALQQCESLPPSSSYRTVFLRLASLVFLLISLWNQITCGGNMEAEGCKTCGYNYRELPVRTLWGDSCAYRYDRDRWNPVHPLLVWEEREYSMTAYKHRSPYPCTLWVGFWCLLAIWSVRCLNLHVGRSGLLISYFFSAGRLGWARRCTNLWSLICWWACWSCCWSSFLGSKCPAPACSSAPMEQAPPLSKSSCFLSYQFSFNWGLYTSKVVCHWVRYSSPLYYYFILFIYWCTYVFAWAYTVCLCVGGG